MPEAPVRMSKNGLVVDGEGWFVVNARESRWKDEGPLGSYSRSRASVASRTSESTSACSNPGSGSGCTTARTDRKRFSSSPVSARCSSKGEERRLAAWDFFYCAPQTEHIIVANTEQAAVLLAVGARGRGVGGGLVYTVCKAAARHGASVVRETADASVAYAQVYATLPRSRFVKFRPGWLPKTPERLV